MSKITVDILSPVSGNTINVQNTLAGTATTASYVNVSGVDNFLEVLGPTITGVNPTILSFSETQTLYITGSNFTEDCIGYLKDSQRNILTPTTSTRNSSTLITLFFSGSDRVQSVNDPKDVIVKNRVNVKSILREAITGNTAPAWVTPAGKLGEIYASSSLTASFFVSASDSENDTLTYSVTGGALPEGLSLISGTGEITGSSLIPLDTGSYNSLGVNYNFTLGVTDSKQSVNRSFYITKKWFDGSTEALAAPSALYIKNNTGINTNGNYWIQPPGQSAYQIYCDMTNQNGGWMLVAVGREGTSTESGNRDWWRDGGDTAGAYATGLKQTNLPESGNTNPRYMPVTWIQAACGGNTWNEIEMICNRTELSDSLYYRSAANNFAWSNFESYPAAFNLTISRHTGQWLGGSTSYTYTGNYWIDTLTAGVASNDATRIFTWTWDGHSAGGVQYTGWSAGSAISAPPGFEAGTENHAIQFVNVFVR